MQRDTKGSARRGGAKQGERQRLAIAVAAAKIIAEEGLSDWRRAKAKAAERLNAPLNCQLPSNQEIERALAEHQILFHAAEHELWLRQQLGIARQVAVFLEPYQPKISGRLAAKTVTEFTAVQIHLFTDNADGVHALLAERNIDFQILEKSYSQQDGSRMQRPALGFIWQSTAVELVVFKLTDRSKPPLCPISKQAMQWVAIPA